MSLTLIGLGLWDETDVSVKGLAAIRAADVVFIEHYTAFLGGASAERLAALHGRAPTLLARADIEDGRVILEAARTRDVALLVVGDSLTATTHVELAARARRAGIPVRIVHGASIATAAAGVCGLSNYKFGRATTLVFPEGDYFPTSPYDVVRDNLARGLHTLCLLDLRAGGSEHENRSPGPSAPRYMSASEGAGLLLRMEEERAEGALSRSTLAVGLARVGSEAPKVVAGALEALARVDFGAPLHTLIVPGKLQFAEEEAVAALCERA